MSFNLGGGLNLGNIGSKLGDAKKLVDSISPVLKMFGVDPAHMVNNIGRDRSQKAVNLAITECVTYYENKGVTPAKKITSDQAEYILVRDYLYQISKHTIKHLLDGLPIPGLAGTVLNALLPMAADKLRDDHDDKVFANIKGMLDPEDSVESAVKMIAKELFEEVF
jgi:hypothetical protein